MKPETQLSDLSLENQTNRVDFAVDKLPEVVPDPGIEKGAEKKEKTADLRAIASDVSNATMPIQPVMSPPATDNDDISTTILDSPLAAGDDDLIEKEWVDRAKRIVTETRNDPYKRDEDVNQLRSEYTKKRYGRELGASEQIAA
jgi:hypothetical protein